MYISANIFKNFISTSTVQSIRSLRNDFFSYLTDLGFVPHHLQPSSEVLNSNCDNTNLVKSVILGGLWPHAARVRIRTGAQKFDQVQAGTIAREIKARDYLLYDIKDGRVFLHPGSILFDTTSWKSDFVTYFNKYATDKVYLRDATQVSIKACITGTHANESIGATVRIVAVGRPRSGQSRCGRPERDQQRQHYQIEGVAAHWYTSQSTSARPYFVSSHCFIDIISSRLLDAQLAKCLENTTILANIPNRSIVDAFKLLITHDGMSIEN